MPSLEDIVKQLTEKANESASLVVARKGTARELDARKVNLATDATGRFSDLCRDAIDDVSQRTVVVYTAEAELTSSETFVIDDKDTLDELTDLRALAVQASTLPTTAPHNLDLSIQLYAVVLGNDSRAVFVRKTDPTMTFKAGRILAIGQDQLRLLEEPVFGFSPGLDLILTEDWAVVLNQSGFERLFRDIGLIERHVSQWVRGITDHLPMASAGVAALEEVALRDSRVWRKLREIRRRGHLASVDLKEVTRYARRMGLDPKTIVQDGQLVFDPTNRFSFLHLLNEDLYKGPLTDEAFEAQTSWLTSLGRRRRAEGDDREVVVPAAVDQRRQNLRRAPRRDRRPRRHHSAAPSSSKSPRASGWPGPLHEPAGSARGVR